MLLHTETDSLILLRIVVATFFTHSLKTQLYQSGSNEPSSSCTFKRSRTEILWARGALPHASPYTTQYLCIHSSKINALFSQNFSLNRRIKT
ncbi:unnamed protein product [Tenebrio molitor]|nr:unnamed protein product [Tenebrio molitor]